VVGVLDESEAELDEEDVDEPSDDATFARA
jgi:hypothetical protein